MLCCTNPWHFHMDKHALVQELIYLDIHQVASKKSYQLNVSTHHITQNVVSEVFQHKDQKDELESMQRFQSNGFEIKIKFLNKKILT